MTLKDLFFEVADLPDEAAQRTRLLELGATPEQLAQVLDLCARERRRAPTTPTRFSQPVAAAVAQFSANELQSGDRLGPWRLGEALGEGGMGRVFLVERADGLYQQRAALKLLRGAAPPELLARERQILATLEHPHIARLLDGGSTPRGRPYFVMAYVEGLTLDRWAATASLAQRLAVIEQIASALDFAHRHLIVHCDLKPANVLVGESGHAVLLDFGIARLEQEGDASLHGLTPHYASPEQLRGEPLSSSTDVFSFGKLVEGLLAGSPREREWRAVVTKAMADDPAQRYPSALALVEDLRRWRTHRPLLALPQSAGYVTAKALRRQWPSWLAGGLLLTMAAVFTWQLAQSRDRAQREARSAQQTADFLVGLFQGADSMDGGRPDLPVIDLLERGRERLGRELAEQPELRGRMQGVLAKVYRRIGRPKDALTLAEEAAKAPFASLLDQATALSELARIQAVAANLDSALETAQRALALRQTGADPVAVSDSHHQMLLLLSDARRFEEAEAQGRLASELLTRHAPEDLERQATLQANLGRLQLFAGHPAQAEPLMRRALALRQQVDGPGHGRTLITATTLAAVLHDLQRLPEAEALLRQLVEQRRRLHGPDSQHVTETQRELAYVLLDADRPDEALAQMREALASIQRVTGPDSAMVANGLRSLAETQAAAGDVAGAEASFAEAVQRGRGKLLSARTEARLRRAWAQLQFDAGRAAEAESVLAPALEQLRTKSKLGETDRVEVELLAAELALARGTLVPARELLASLHAQAPAAGAARRPERSEALLLRLQGLVAAASGGDGSKQLSEAWARGSKAMGPGDPRLQPLRLSHIESLLRRGRAQEAAPLLAVLRQQVRRLPTGHALRVRVEQLQGNTAP